MYLSFKQFYIDPLNYLNGQGDQVVYANNFFSGQTSECQNAATHTETASNGDDPNYTGANLFGGLWSGTCGTSNIFKNSQSNRIVGGEETEEHQYPWMVGFSSLYVKFKVVRSRWNFHNSPGL
jgi:hypothetical protein